MIVKIVIMIQIRLKRKKTNETKSQDDVESLNIKDLPKSTEMNMKKDIKIKDEQNKIIIKKIQSNMIKIKSNYLWILFINLIMYLNQNELVGH